MIGGIRTLWLGPFKIAATFKEGWQAFLKRLFELAARRPNVFVEGEAVIATLGFDAQTTTSVVDYLLEKEFIRSRDGKLVAITVEGIDALQNARLI